MMKIDIQQEYIADKTKKCRIKWWWNCDSIKPCQTIVLDKNIKRVEISLWSFQVLFSIYLLSFPQNDSTLFGPTSLWILKKFLCHLLHQILFSGNKLMSNFILRRHEYKRLWCSLFQRILHFQRHIPKLRNRLLMFEFLSSGSGIKSFIWVKRREVWGLS